ncbi:MAG: SCO family protein [Xanthomonadales bacterium]|nr:SCO family protein [Xanthomonadales bacterium]
MSQSKNNTRFFLLAASLALLAALSGALFFKTLQMRGQNNLQSLIVLPEAKTIADFALIDESGQPFSLGDFKDRWSLLFFGFTNCPDICPNTLYQLQQVRKELLGKLDASEMPVIYLVSVDPDRDTPQKLAEYLSFFDPALKGLTGDDRQLRALTMQLGIVYHVAEHDAEDKEYAVDHSASLVLLSPQATLFGVFPAPQQIGSMSHDLLQVID